MEVVVNPKRTKHAGSFTERREGWGIDQTTPTVWMEPTTVNDGKGPGCSLWRGRWPSSNERRQQEHCQAGMRVGRGSHDRESQSGCRCYKARKVDRLEGGKPSRRWDISPARGRKDRVLGSHRPPSLVVWWSVVAELEESEGMQRMRMWAWWTVLIVVNGWWMLEVWIAVMVFWKALDECNVTV